MRSEVMVLLVCLGGCAIDLGRSPHAAPAAPSAAVAVVASCPLLRDEPGGVLGVAGQARSLDAEDGQVQWFLEGLRVRQPDGSEPQPGGSELVWRNVSLPIPATATAAHCLGGLAQPQAPTPLFDATGLPPGQSLQPLAPLRAGPGTWLYFAVDVADPTAPFGIRRAGYGVARSAGFGPPFQLAAAALWSGDGPSFGSAAVIEGDLAYVYGCKNAGFLAADCYVARAPADKLDDAAAYVYDSGSGHWTADAEHAAPTMHAGNGLAVQYQPLQHRYVAVYVTPLGKQLTLRTGLTPTGPWSQPRDVAGCELPKQDTGSFCGGVALHPQLAGLGAGELAITYTINTFQRPAGLGDAAYDTRLVVLPVPTNLP